MKTLNWSAGLFAAAASLGGYLATEVFREQETRKGVALIHGPLAATGLGLLVYSAIKEKRKDLAAPVAMFAGAALGGSYLFIRDMFGGKRPQVSITAVHGGIAVTAFSFLLSKIMTGDKQSLSSQRSESLSAPESNVYAPA